MKAGVILNGISLRKKFFYKRILPLLREYIQVDIFETQSRDDAYNFAAKAVHQQFDLILAAGGDGTVHHVVNGMLKEPVPDLLPVFGVIPLGSGNDFARAWGSDANPRKLIQSIKRFNTVDIDLGQAECRVKNGSEERHHRYFLNVADTGMGPEVVERVERNGRALGSGAAYYKAIIDTFISYRPKYLEAISERFHWQDRVRTFAVANGRYFGSGLCIAPEASFCDGRLNVFACGPVSVIDFIRNTIPLKKGRIIRHPLVKYYTSTEVQLTSTDELTLETDGEICGWLPATIRLSQVKLRMLKTSDHC